MAPPNSLVASLSFAAALSACAAVSSPRPDAAVDVDALRAQAAPPTDPQSSTPPSQAPRTNPEPPGFRAARLYDGPGYREPRRRFDAVFDARVTLAGGTYEHDIDGSLDDETSGGFFGLTVEAAHRDSGLGGGITFEVTSSDDDLFEGQGTNPAQVSIVELSPFFLYRFQGGERFRMPVRLGPWLHVVSLDDQGSSDEIRWVTLGLKVDVEPELVLVRNSDFELSGFSEISLAGGGTRVHVENAGTDDDFDSDAAAFGFEIGPRFRWSHFFASLSFLHRGVALDESDPENNVVVRGVDTRFDALAISFGGGF